MGARITYEQATCGRCGGTGSYSYNSMHGSVCYGCSGRKRVLSRAGAKASAAVKAFIKDNFSVRVSELRAGDVIRYDGKARTIAEVTRGGGRQGYRDAATGEMVWVDTLTLTFTRPYATSFGPCSGVGMPENATVERAPAGADWQRVVDFARGIRKGLKIEEGEAANV